MTLAAEALWQAVYDAPLDDAPRLRLAEALTRAGDPRGEFITLQVERADDPKAAAKAEKLLRKHRDAWLGPLAEHLARKGACVFRRGFAAEAEVRVRGDAREVAKLRAWATFEKIDFSYHAVSFMAPHLRALTHVGPLGPEAARVLTEADAPWRIESLDLGYRAALSLAPDAFDPLAECRALPHLRALTLEGGDDCAWLWRSPLARTIESFTWHKAVTPRELRAVLLAALAHAPRLRAMTLAAPAWWRHYALRFAFTSDDDERLSRLMLDHAYAWQHPAGLRALMALPPASLTALTVACAPERRPSDGQRAEVEAIARRFTRLRTLDLRATALIDVRSLAEGSEAPAWTRPDAAPPISRVIAGGVTVARFSDDDAWLVLASGPQLFALSTADWTLRATVADAPWTDLCVTRWITALAISRDARRCAVTEEGGEGITSLPFEAVGELTRTATPPWVGNMATSHDGALHAAWATYGKSLHLFRSGEGAQDNVFATRAPIQAVAFASDDDAVFVATNDGSVRRMSLQSGRFDRGGFEFRMASNGATLEASRDGRWLAAASPGTGVRLWSLADGARLDVVAPVEGSFDAVGAAFSRHASALVFSHRDGVFARDLDARGETRRVLDGRDGGARVLAVSRDARWAAIAEGGGARVCELRDGRTVWSSTP